MIDDPARFELPPVMKMEDCERLHAFLAAAVDQDVEIDCSAVERLSGLAAQMLAAAHASWQRKAVQLTCSSPSDGFEQGAALLGLSDLITHRQVAA